MLYIEEKPKYWEIQRRFDNGDVHYNLINKTGLNVETRHDKLEMRNINPTGGQIINYFNRFDILKPPALSDRALKVALLNPYMEGGGGGGTNSEYQTQYIIQSVVDFLDLFGANASKQITLPKATYLIDSVNLDMLDYTLIATEDITIRGFSQNINQITSTANGVDLITVNGANLFLDNIKIEASGTGSQAIVMTGTGVESLDAQYVEFVGATAWGTLTNLRQGFLVFSFAFGSTRGFLLRGAWNGFRISSSRFINVSQYIVKGDATVGPTFFTCDAFRGDPNVSVPAGSFAFSFTEPSMFNDDNAFQILGGRFDGSGQMVEDFTGGIAVENTVQAFFRNNEGNLAVNTYPGAKWDCTVEVPTVLPIGVDTKLNGTTVLIDNTHFDQTANNTIRYLNSQNRVFIANSSIGLNGTANTPITLKLFRNVGGLGTTYDLIGENEDVIINLPGLGDRVTIPLLGSVNLDKDDTIELFGRCDTASTTVTMRTSSYTIIQPK